MSGNNNNHHGVAEFCHLATMCTSKKKELKEKELGEEE
jgi:hypothetical protein